MVTKPSGFAGDCCLVNTHNQLDRHPLPIIEDLLQKVNGKVFSVIDLHKAFLQISVADQDIEKTVVATPFGLYEVLGMSPGLKNGSQTLQRAKNHLYRKFSFVCTYQDDDRPGLF